MQQPAGVTYQDGDRKQETNSNLAQSTSVSNEREKEITLLGMENLAEVQIHDLFECHKCSMTFDEKDSYLQHLLSFHQRTTRRYRLGSSVGDGVIIKDGKYECQFCHKVFLERRRYNGHVGIHVRNYVRRVEEMPVSTPQKRIESPVKDDMPSRISKMDALIEIAQSSILETSTSGANDRFKCDSEPNNPRTDSSPEIPASNSDQELDFDSPLSEQELEDSIIGRYHNQEDSRNEKTEEYIKKPNDANEILDVKMDSCLDNTTLFCTKKEDDNASNFFLGKDGLALIANELDKPSTEQDGAPESSGVAPLCHQTICDVDSNTNMNQSGNLELSNSVEIENKKKELKVDNDSCNDRTINDTVKESTLQTSEEKELHCGVSDSSMSIVQQLHCFPPFNAVSDKVFIWFLHFEVQNTLNAFVGNFDYLINLVVVSQSFRIVSNNLNVN